VARSVSLYYGPYLLVLKSISVVTAAFVCWVTSDVVGTESVLLTRASWIHRCGLGTSGSGLASFNSSRSDIRGSCAPSVPPLMAKAESRSVDYSHWPVAGLKERPEVSTTRFFRFDFVKPSASKCRTGSASGRHSRIRAGCLVGGVAPNPVSLAAAWVRQRSSQPTAGRVCRSGWAGVL
jgi:hypothetical protein